MFNNALYKSAIETVMSRKRMALSQATLEDFLLACKLYEPNFVIHKTTYDAATGEKNNMFDLLPGVQYMYSSMPASAGVCYDPEIDDVCCYPIPGIPEGDFGIDCEEDGSRWHYEFNVVGPAIVVVNIEYFKAAEDPAPIPDNVLVFPGSRK